MHAWKSLSSNTKSAIVVTGLAILWMLTGLLGTKSAPQEIDKTQAPQVATEEFHTQTYEQKLTLIGRTEAERKAHIAAKINEEVVATPVVEGTHVKKGETLLKLDVATRKESVAAAKANLVAAEKLVEAARKLHAEGFQSDVTLASREADVANAAETLARAEEELADTHIKAPFNGLVERVYVEVGDFAAVGTALVDLLGTDNFLLVGHVSQNDRAHVSQGTTATARLANGVEVEGTIRFIARDANTETKTYRMEVLVDGSKYPELAAGMSAEIQVPTTTVAAHKIPHAALVLGSNGDLGVMRASSETAHFTPITILADTAKDAWVTGLPDVVTIITRGQTAIRDGSAIRHAPAKPEETEQAPANE